MAHTPRVLTAIAVVGLLATAGTAAAVADDPAPRTAKATPAATVQAWEYTWVIASPGGKVSEPKKNNLNLEALGKQGWEVVAPVDELNGGYWNFLLKRPLKNN